MKDKATQSQSGLPRSRRSKGLRVLLWIVAAFLAIAIVVRLVLDPVASYEMRKALNGLDGYVADFERVHVTLFGPGFEVWRFKLAEARNTERGDEKALAKDPLIFVEHASLGVDGRALLHGHIEGRLR